MPAVLISFLILLCLAGSAQAERRMFLVENDADGYGVDRCLASGLRCGAAVANAYCKMQAFAEAATFHKVGRGDITGAVATDATACRGDRHCLHPLTASRTNNLPLNLNAAWAVVLSASRTLRRASSAPLPSLMHTARRP